MAKRKRASSRLQTIEDKKNKKQAALFMALSIGFLIILIIVGIPLFEKAIIWLGDSRGSNEEIDKNDNIPPIAPRIVTDYEATKSGNLTVRGYSEVGSTVSLYVNNTKNGEMIADMDGEFLFPDIKLMEGENYLYAKATDKAGNISQDSVNTVVVFDDKAPELSVNSPSDGDKFYYEEREILVSGETEVDVNVRVNGYVVIVDTEGNFVKKLTLSNGDNEIEIKAYDKAGNETQKKIKVSYYE